MTNTITLDDKASSYVVETLDDVFYETWVLVHAIEGLQDTLDPDDRLGIVHMLIRHAASVRKVTHTLGYNLDIPAKFSAGEVPND